MLVALQQFDKEELIAALLLFRLLYFIIPFGLALVIMGTRETLLAVRLRGEAGRRRRKPPPRAVMRAPSDRPGQGSRGAARYFSP